MERGKSTSTGRGAKSKAPQHPQDIFALGSKSTVVVSEKRNIHKPSSSGVDRKRETTTFGSQPPNKRARIGSPAESVSGTSLEVDPVDLVPNALQALDTHNSDKLLGLLTGSIRLLKSQRAKPDPILCMSMLYLVKIRPNMFSHDTVMQALCTLLKREQGAAFKNKGNPLVYILACNMLYAAHKDSNNWPDTFIKVYIEDALNERWWVDCDWSKCLVENIVTAFNTKKPPAHLLPTDSALGTMSPSGSGSPLTGNNEDEVDNNDLEYSVFPRYTGSYEVVEGLVLEAIKEQLQRRAAPDAVGKGFLKLLTATCGFPEIRMIAASRLEAWLHSGKLWRAAQELLAALCCNATCQPRDHDALAQLARMRLKTKPLQSAYHACLRDMCAASPALLRSVVTHTVYNELSNVRAPNNMAVLAALLAAQPQLLPLALAETFVELLHRADDFLRPLRLLTRELLRAARLDAAALLPLAHGLATLLPHEPAQEIRERAFLAIADLICVVCLGAAGAGAGAGRGDLRPALADTQARALAWLLDAAPVYKPTKTAYMLALNKIMFVESAETYSKMDNWPPESERAAVLRVCSEIPLLQTTLLRLIFQGLSKDTPVSPAEMFDLVEQLVRRACALPPEDNPLQVDKLKLVDYIFQLCAFTPPDNITLPQTGGAVVCVASLHWRAWVLLTLVAAHNADTFAARAADLYPTLRALIDTCITNKPSIEWNAATETDRAEAERTTILQLEAQLAAASNPKATTTLTDHNSRLLSQLTVLDLTGPARRPPPATLEMLSMLNAQLRLGRLLCRQPQLLLALVERHGTRKAMPWLHHILANEPAQLSVLPVQCVCEFVCSGGGGGGGGAEGAEGGPRAGELLAHVRRSLAASPAGARAVLGYYAARLAHAHAHSRAAAKQGLKLVLATPEEEAENNPTAEMNLQVFLPRLWDLAHWGSVEREVVGHVVAACGVECVPRDLAAYLLLLHTHVQRAGPATLATIVTELSQVLMERSTVLSHILPMPPPAPAPPPDPHFALTSIFYTYMKHIRKSGSEPPGASFGRATVSLQWAGAACSMPVLVAHAHLKLLCYPPCPLDTNQEMYSYLESIWVGAEAPLSYTIEGLEEAELFPDWLRLLMVRSPRPALLQAGLKGLPASKLALFIQTFGMPVASMSALLHALDECPASAVSRVSVERAYMAQLLQVQAQRGARGGAAFAAALRLPRPPAPAAPSAPLEERVFARTELPPEPKESSMLFARNPPRHRGVLQGSDVTLDVIPDVLSGTNDEMAAPLLTKISEEVQKAIQQGSKLNELVYLSRVVQHLRSSPQAPSPAVLAPLLTAMLPVKHLLHDLAPQLVGKYKCVCGPVRSLLAAMLPPAACPPPAAAPPAHADKHHIIHALENASPNTLEALGNYLIRTQDVSLVIDVITHILEKCQNQSYDSPKQEGDCPPHMFSSSGRGCGLLLDWLSQLQPEIVADYPYTQMVLLFSKRSAPWRPLLVTLLAHRASWRTLHTCLRELLTPGRESVWSPMAVLQLTETLVNSERVWQSTAHNEPLNLTAEQVQVLVQQVCAAGGAEGGAGGGAAGGARGLRLLLRLCAEPAAALRAAHAHPHLTYQVPKIEKLLMESYDRPPIHSPVVDNPLEESPRPADAVSHTLLTALAALPPSSHNAKSAVVESGVRAVWARVGGAGARALPLAGAVLRAAPRPSPTLLAALDALPDAALDPPPPHNEEMFNIMESVVLSVAGAGGGAGGREAGAHRAGALLRRYVCAAPAQAQLLLAKHSDLIASVPALAGAAGAEGGAGASQPPPHALAQLQRRNLPPAMLATLLQEVEAWGTRRGGGWGGAAAARSVLRAAAPLAAAAHAAPRHAALALLVRLLPACSDTRPALQVILECLDSPQPEIAQSMLDKLPELLVSIQEHAALILARVFELGIKSRYPVDQCLSKCVANINLLRGC